MAVETLPPALDTLPSQTQPIEAGIPAPNPYAFEGDAAPTTEFSVAGQPAPAPEAVSEGAPVETPGTPALSPGEQRVYEEARHAAEHKYSPLSANAPTPENIPEGTPDLFRAAIETEADNALADYRHESAVQADILSHKSESDFRATMAEAADRGSHLADFSWGDTTESLAQMRQHDMFGATPAPAPSYATGRVDHLADLSRFSHGVAEGRVFNQLAPIGAMNATEAATPVADTMPATPTIEFGRPSDVVFDGNRMPVAGTVPDHMYMSGEALPNGGGSRTHDNAPIPVVTVAAAPVVRDRPSLRPGAIPRGAGTVRPPITGDLGPWRAPDNSPTGPVAIEAPETAAPITPIRPAGSESASTDPDGDDWLYSLGEFDDSASLVTPEASWLDEAPTEQIEAVDDSTEVMAAVPAPAAEAPAADEKPQHGRLRRGARALGWAVFNPITATKRGYREGVSKLTDMKHNPKLPEPEQQGDYDPAWDPNMVSLGHHSEQHFADEGVYELPRGGLSKGAYVKTMKQYYDKEATKEEKREALDAGLITVDAKGKVTAFLDREGPRVAATPDQRRAAERDQIRAKVEAQREAMTRQAYIDIPKDFPKPEGVSDEDYEHAIDGIVDDEIARTYFDETLKQGVALRRPTRNVRAVASGLRANEYVYEYPEDPRNVLRAVDYPETAPRRGSRRDRRERRTRP